jgi:nitroreductase
LPAYSKASTIHRLSLKDVCFMDALSLLLGRNSAAKLCEPAPHGDALDNIYQAALRAPDHARLRPWRFLTVAGDGRYALGDLYAEALALRNPQATPQELDKARGKSLRAPLLIVVIACIKEHPKVPLIEQQLSAGCAAHGMLLAAHAQGFAGIWRTGANAFDRKVMDGLGLGVNEQIIGFLYLGSVDGNAKPLPKLNVTDFVQEWK